MTNYDCYKIERQEGIEELFVYSLLYNIGYEKHDEYRESLDNLFCYTPEDEILLDFKGRDYKNAMLYLFKSDNERIIF